MLLFRFMQTMLNPHSGTISALIITQVRFFESLFWLVGNFALFSISEFYNYLMGEGLFKLCKPIACLYNRLGAFVLTGLIFPMIVIVIIEVSCFSLNLLYLVSSFAAFSLTTILLL